MNNAPSSDVSSVEAPLIAPVPNDQLSNHIEVWKKIIDVQQHFNDLELRIRNFALITTGAFIGVGGYAIKDGGIVSLWGSHFSVAGLVVFCSLLPLVAFYFMDRLWYHRLLDGAVKAAIPLEDYLNKQDFIVHLGKEISKASPFVLCKKRIHSRHKIDGFYSIIAVGILILALVLGFGIRPAVTAPAHDEDSVKVSERKESAPTPSQRKSSSVRWNRSLLKT